MSLTGAKSNRDGHITTMPAILSSRPGSKIPIARSLGPCQSIPAKGEESAQPGLSIIPLESEPLPHMTDSPIPAAAPSIIGVAR